MRFDGQIGEIRKTGIDRALRPLVIRQGRLPGALPQAGIGCAFGALIDVDALVDFDMGRSQARLS
jgi:hypothetical protein